MTRYLLAACAGMLGMVFAAPAAAQATRTWVSGVGDDANPCSRTAPCQTFAGAIAKTAAGGEINCLDRGEFGMLTITKAISIICEGRTGAVQLNYDEEVEYDQHFAIVVEAGPNDSVFLSGLDILGDNRAGRGGVLFRSGKELHVRNSTFYYLGDCAITAIDAGSVVVDDVVSAFNFCGLGFYNRSVGAQNFSAHDVRIIDSSLAGIVVSNSSPTASISGVVSGSHVATTQAGVWGGMNDGLSAIATSGQIRLTVKNSRITGHQVRAIDARGSGTKVMVSGSVIAHNQLGISSQGGAAVVSFGDNMLFGNVQNGSFTGNATKK